jgi:hypothetical protein
MHSLLDAGVVDEVRMLVCPASRGEGTRIFEDWRDLKLVEATPFENGVYCCATRSRSKRNCCPLIDPRRPRICPVDREGDRMRWLRVVTLAGALAHRPG